ncbi:MAG: RusA family crossover junction endodeoxyribonuclease [Phycisphaerales bacterium]
MAERLEFVVRGTPEPQPRPRAQVIARPGRKAFAHIYTPDDARDWRKAVLWAARRTPGFPADPWVGPIRVSIEAHFKRPERLMRKDSPDGPIRKNSKPDVDNVLKSVLDALTPPRPKKAMKNEAIRAALRRGYLWVDDCQVHLGPVDRFYAAKDCAPGVIVIAERIEEEAACSS